MNSKSLEMGIPVTGRTYKEYCNIFCYDSKNGKNIVGKRILDVGIGHSTFARYVNEHFPSTQVVGIDFADLRTGAKFSARNPEELAYPQAQTIRADANSLPFQDELSMMLSRLILYNGSWAVKKQLM